jgi:hypothetical protein
MSSDFLSTLSHNNNIHNKKPKLLKTKGKTDFSRLGKTPKPVITPTLFKGSKCSLPHPSLMRSFCVISLRLLPAFSHPFFHASLLSVISRLSNFVTSPLHSAILSARNFFQKTSLFSLPALDVSGPWTYLICASGNRKGRKARKERANEVKESQESEKSQD